MLLSIIHNYVKIFRVKFIWIRKIDRNIILTYIFSLTGYLRSLLNIYDTLPVAFGKESFRFLTDPLIEVCSSKYYNTDPSNKYIYTNGVLCGIRSGELSVFASRRKLIKIEGQISPAIF